jgi:hypothetical protein
MTLYRPRGPIIQAFRMGFSDPVPGWVREIEADRENEAMIACATLDEAWILRRPDGEIRTMAHWLFTKEYEPVEGGA